MLRKLPLGIHTFSKLRKDNCLYIDKTEHAYNLITQGYRYFLSRPRRFGKSLFVSTLKEILTGNKSLFDGLWIAQSDYQWQEHGVIALDFSGVAGDTIKDIKSGLCNLLTKIANDYNLDIKPSSTNPGQLLQAVAHALHARFGHVALLVDEYDSPILRALQDPRRAEKIRNTIQQFFTTVKSLDAEMNFIFITGVSSFAKAGLFSGINNLTLITLDEQYSSICGYTDQEIDDNMGNYIQAWADKEKISYATIRDQMKTWYNGYHFGEHAVPVYNPFSILHALRTQNFKNFWFESGMPTFLVNVLRKQHTAFDPEQLEITESSLGVFDVGATPLLALMFQAGYLTIKGYDQERKRYILDYPNAEVRDSLQVYLFEVFAHMNHSESEHVTNLLYKALNSGNIEQIIETIKQLFAHVPYQLHMPAEKFYHALFQMACTAGGIKAQSEYSTSHGRIDLILDLPTHFYVAEVKFNEPAENALTQIKERRYYERFIGQQKPIILLGLAFKRAPQVFDVTYASEKL